MNISDVSRRIGNQEEKKQEILVRKKAKQNETIFGKEESESLYSADQPITKFSSIFAHPFLIVK